MSEKATCVRINFFNYFYFLFTIIQLQFTIIIQFHYFNSLLYNYTIQFTIIIQFIYLLYLNYIVLYFIDKVKFILDWNYLINLTSPVLTCNEFYKLHVNFYVNIQFLCENYLYFFI